MPTVCNSTVSAAAPFASSFEAQSSVCTDELKGKVAKLEQRKAELEQLTTEACTDDLAEEHTLVTSQLKKFRNLMSAAAGADFKGGSHIGRGEKTEAEAAVAEALVALGSIPILRGLTNGQRASLSRRLEM